SSTRQPLSSRKRSFVPNSTYSFRPTSRNPSLCSYQDAARATSGTANVTEYAVADANAFRSTMGSPPFAREDRTLSARARPSLGLLRARLRRGRALHELREIDPAAERGAEADDLGHVRRRSRHLAQERAQVVRGVQPLALREEAQELQLFVREEE